MVTADKSRVWWSGGPRAGELGGEEERRGGGEERRRGGGGQCLGVEDKARRPRPSHVEAPHLGLDYIRPI